MDGQNVFEWLWLVNCFGCANKRIWEFMNNFPDITEAYNAMLDPEKRRKLLTAAENSSAARVTEKQVTELISYCVKHDIYILTFDDEKYPERLKSIFDPPAALFCKGDIGCLKNDFSLSVVGTREPSNYSVKVTEALVRSLSENGITIVSGFAVGIDITANLSAVRNGGKTIAVLGSGIDNNYPRENAPYRKEIEENGLFVSEYFPTASGSVRTFPARNRILTGLSLGTIVVEAGIKSGALNSASLAMSQGRDVFAVAPHNLFDVRYGGNVNLIRDGATCLCGVNDILYEYYENYGHKIANTAAMHKTVPGNETDIDIDIAETAAASGKKSVKVKKISSEMIKIPEKAAYDPSGLDGDELEIYNFLKEKGKAVQIDEIASNFDMDISEMLSLLTELEIEGAVSSAAGQSYGAN